jgi:hypothetical protein
MNLRELVDKAMDDPKFYEQLKRDPEEALRSLGAEPTERQVQLLRGLDYKYLEKVVEEFGPKILVT